MRKLVLTGLSGGMVIFALTGCAQPSARESSEIADGGDTWQELYNARDIEGLLGLYTEDARLLPPNDEMAEGHDAIREDLQALMDTGLTGTLETVEAMAAGDLGYRVGTFTLETPDGTVADRGKYIETWRLVDGEWKISNDIFNSDLPAPGPTGTLVMGSHEVGDPSVWLAAWQEDEERREQFARHGAASVRVFQDPENPSMTGLLIDVVDMEAFQEFLASEEGETAKAEDTVKDEGLRLLVEVE